ncbi:MAG TPA: hypothetical protein VJZ49_09735 [Syntrophales bacterium]|nr:hypothetical protein [Syntrophales bacterium]
MSGNESDVIYVIMPDMYDEHHGYELGTIWQGMPGVHATGYYCGHDLEDAIEYAQELNTERGHTAEFVAQVLKLVLE